MFLLSYISFIRRATALLIIILPTIVQAQSKFEYFKSNPGNSSSGFALTEIDDKVLISGREIINDINSDFIDVLDNSGNLLTSISIKPDSINSFLNLGIQNIDNTIYTISVANPELGAYQYNPLNRLYLSKLDVSLNITKQIEIIDNTTIANLIPRHQFLVRNDTLFLLLQYTYDNNGANFGFCIYAFDKNLNKIAQSPSTYIRPSMGQFLGIGSFNIVANKIYFTVDEYPGSTEIYCADANLNISKKNTLEYTPSGTETNVYDGCRGLWFENNKIYLFLNHTHFSSASNKSYKLPSVVILNDTLEVKQTKSIGYGTLLNRQYTIGEGIHLEPNVNFLAGVDSSFVVYEGNTEHNPIFIAQTDSLNNLIKISFFRLNRKMSITRLFKSNTSGFYALGFYAKDDEADQYISNYFVVKFDDKGQLTWINDLANKKSLQIYPNPTTDRISIPNTQKGDVYKIYNIQGQQVTEGTIDGTDSIVVQSLPTGKYQIQLHNKETILLSGFIKQ